MFNKNKDHSVGSYFENSRTFSIFQVLKNSTNYMRNVCGLNVHKDNVFMCILKENGDKIEEKFGVLTPEHILLFQVPIIC